MGESRFYLDLFFGGFRIYKEYYRSTKRVLCRACFSELVPSSATILDLKHVPRALWYPQTETPVYVLSGNSHLQSK